MSTDKIARNKLSTGRGNPNFRILEEIFNHFETRYVNFIILKFTFINP